MIDITTLEFFDSNGYNLNFKLIDNIWSGIIKCEPISDGLWDSVNVYIFDKFKLNNNIVYGDIQHNTLNNIQLQYYVKTPNKPFNTYNIVDNELEITNVISNDIDIVNSYTNVENGYKNANNVNTHPQIVNILFGGNGYKEEYYEADLIIQLFNENTDEIQIIARITLIGEVIREDLKLKTLLTNFNQDIDYSEYPVFFDSTLNETHDVQLINQKRKEKLIEISQFRQYNLSYKGLINALRYYGYEFLNIKEYWKVDNEFVLVDILNSVINKPSKFKTNFLQLHYPINEVDYSTLDNNGNSVITENFNLDLSSIMVKLYGLKNILETKYLPQNVKILDIVGEYNMFNNLTTLITINKHRIEDIKHGLNIDIELDKPLYVLEDIKDYLLTNTTTTNSLLNTFLDYEVDNEFNLSKLQNDITTGDINTQLLNGFVLKEETLLSNFIGGDTFSNLIGSYVNITLKDLKDLSIDKLHGISVNTTHSINTLQYHPFYEIRWVITHNTKNYVWDSGILNIYDNNSINVILPFNGGYTIKVTLYDLFGSTQTDVFSDLLNVLSPNIDIIGYKKEYNKKTTINSISKQKIKNTHGTITHIKNTSVPLTDLFDYTIDTFNLSNYNTNNVYSIDNCKDMPVKTNYLTIQDTKYSSNTKPLAINEFKDLMYGNIDNYGHFLINDFKTTNISQDFPSYGTIFRFNDIGDNNIIINGIHFHYNSVQTLEDINSVISGLRSTFTFLSFNPIWEYDNNGDIIGLYKLFFNSNSQSTILEVDYYTDVNIVNYNDVYINNGKLLIHTQNNPITISPSLNNLELLTMKTVENIKPYTLVFFDISNNGYKYNKFLWEITYKDNIIYTYKNNIIYTHKNKYMGFLFKKNGFYTIQLTVWDINGNMVKNNTVNIINVK